MPSVSKKQHNFMAMVANSPKMAKQIGIKQSVGKDFIAADKGKKFKKGGDTMAKFNPFAGKETKGEEGKEKKAVKGKAGYAKAEKKFEGENYKCGGKVKKHASGGDIEPDMGSLETKKAKQKSKDKEKEKTVPIGQSEDDMSIEPKKYARGGGIELRGKTRGRFI